MHSRSSLLLVCRLDLSLALASPTATFFTTPPHLASDPSLFLQPTTTNDATASHNAIASTGTTIKTALSLHQFRRSSHLRIKRLANLKMALVRPARRTTKTVLMPWEFHRKEIQLVAVRALQRLSREAIQELVTEYRGVKQMRAKEGLIVEFVEDNEADRHQAPAAHDGMVAPLAVTGNAKPQQTKARNNSSPPSHFNRFSSLSTIPEEVEELQPSNNADSILDLTNNIQSTTATKDEMNSHTENMGKSKQSTSDPKKEEQDNAHQVKTVDDIRALLTSNDRMMTQPAKVLPNRQSPMSATEENEAPKHVKTADDIRALLTKTENEQVAPQPATKGSNIPPHEAKVPTLVEDTLVQTAEMGNTINPLPGPSDNVLPQGKESSVADKELAEMQAHGPIFPIPDVLNNALLHHGKSWAIPKKETPAQPAQSASKEKQAAKKEAPKKKETLKKEEEAPKMRQESTKWVNQFLDVSLMPHNHLTFV